MDIKQITSYLLWNDPKYDKISRLEFFEYVEKIYWYNLEKLNFFWEQANKFEEEFYKLVFEKFYSQSKKDDLEKAKLDKLLKELDLPWLDKEEKLILWEYKNEEDFTKNFLLKFFKKLWYLDVKYTHWRKEYWKDIIMRKQDEFWNWRYTWVQSKVWNVSGKTAWPIDELIWQAIDGFSIKVPSLDEKDKVSISEFIIITNWNFMENATDKILEKIKEDSQKNNIHFIDKTKIENMLDEINKN